MPFWGKRAGNYNSIFQNPILILWLLVQQDFARKLYFALSGLKTAANKHPNLLHLNSNSF